MGFRMRKSINLGGGARLNLSKKGVGMSVGTKGFRVTAKAGGGIRTTASIPGTGISYVSEGKSSSSTTTTPAGVSYTADDIRNDFAQGKPLWCDAKTLATLSASAFDTYAHGVLAAAKDVKADTADGETIDKLTNQLHLIRQEVDRRRAAQTAGNSVQTPVDPAPAPSKPAPAPAAPRSHLTAADRANPEKALKKYQDCLRTAPIVIAVFVLACVCFALAGITVGAVICLLLAVLCYACRGTWQRSVAELQAILDARQREVDDL